MPLPFQFSTGTQANTTWLDTDFDAVGLLGALPCSVSGTNDLTLTQLVAVSQPTILSTQAQLQVSGIAASSNTGAVTAAVGGLSPLPVYKDTPTGPAALTGGEIIAANLIVLTYDAALNTGTGGWHLSTSPASSAGTITSVASGTGLTGGPITTTGTLSLANISTLNVLSNITGGSAAPTGNGVSAILDAVFGTTQGSILSRGASLWGGNSETSWTPALTMGGAASGLTYSTRVGQYMAIGYLMVAMFNLVLSAKGSSSGAVTISLPVTSGGSNLTGVGIVGGYANLTSVTTTPFLTIGSSASTASLVIAGSATTAALTDANIANTSAISGFLLYLTG